MAVDRQERMMENLVAAMAIGFTALVVALAAVFSDSAAAQAERSAIAAVSGGAVEAEAQAFDDPAFSRIHPIDGGSAAYGAVLSVPGKQGAIRAALLFRKDGAVASARALGPRPAPAWMKLLVGTGGAASQPASKAAAADPDAVSGATESFLAWADAAGRASSAAAGIGTGSSPGGGDR